MTSRSDASQPDSVQLAAARREATSSSSRLLIGSRVMQHGLSDGPPRARDAREPAEDDPDERDIWG
jgi:hypothetical protein